MNKYTALLSQLNVDSVPIQGDIHSRVLVIDGLNLFFRNFSTLNMVNQDGVHIGGLGGFLRSLGGLINKINPTAIYIAFDGTGSSQNRKNIIPEYKSNRNIKRITNWNIFESVEDEHDSKIDQVIRLIQYLKCLPVKVLSLERVEADDVIAVLAQDITKANPENQVFIVSNDRDYIQLVKSNIILYLPNKQEFLTPNMVFDLYGVMPENFLTYKTLLGDNSDKLVGVKGLGPKTLYKKFPELQERVVSLDDIFEISKGKFKEHIVYARILQNEESLRNTSKIMDLGNPMVDDNDRVIIGNLMSSPLNEYQPVLFNNLYTEDGLGKIIKNLDHWLKNYFEPLSKFSILG